MLKIVKGGDIYYYNDRSKQWEHCNDDMLELTDENNDNICEIEDGVTIGDMFKLVEKYEDFFAERINPLLGDFLEEMSTETDKKSDIQYIEICWGVEERSGYLEEEISINGWCPKPDEAPDITGVDKNGNIPCSLSFVPVNQLKDVPIKLDINYIIYKVDEDKIKEYLDDIDGKQLPLNESLPLIDKLEYPIFKTKRYFTLMDILDVLFFEISFHGLPEERDMCKKELLDTVEKIASGEMETYTQEEIEKMFEEQEVRILEIRQNEDTNDLDKVDKKDEDEEHAIDEIEHLIDEIEEDEGDEN